MVSAVSEEASAPCDNISTSDGFMFKCSIPPNSTVNFTVYSVHSASDSRSIATDSCMLSYATYIYIFVITGMFMIRPIIFRDDIYL